MNANEQGYEEGLTRISLIIANSDFIRENSRNSRQTGFDSSLFVV